MFQDPHLLITNMIQPETKSFRITVLNHKIMIDPEAELGLHRSETMDLRGDAAAHREHGMWDLHEVLRRIHCRLSRSQGDGSRPSEAVDHDREK